jgi:pimeloyl-ACP methyl ester carboxylesterase
MIYLPVSWLTGELRILLQIYNMSKKWFWAVPFILIILYFTGPKPSKPVLDKHLPEISFGSLSPAQYVQQMESQEKVKPDNEARIIWANDSSRQKTEYVIVYLHGFSASQAEGEPVHRNIAKKFGCNLYLSRLAWHGIETAEPMLHLTADNYWESAKKARAIGRQLGRKVILMSTSTGGTLSLMMAGEIPGIHALILLSPNIAIYNDKAYLLNNPWGLQIARAVVSSKYVTTKDQRDIYKKYWYSKYRLEATTQLEELLETAMTEQTFKKVTQPVLTLYYYRDEIHQDSVVKVSAMKTMMQQLGTPANLKRSVAIPLAGDHVIGSYIKSKDLVSVQKETEKFFAETLKLNPVVN